MEKYFKINRGSQLYESYFKWLENARKNAEFYEEFRKENGIESTSYYPSNSYLKIAPTKQDLINFSESFTKESHAYALKSFKKNSKIGRAWIDTAKNIEFLDKPRYFYYVSISGKWRERLFNIEDSLYGSIESECPFELSQCMEEIKASEFYKAIEDYESRNKEE